MQISDVAGGEARGDGIDKSEGRLMEEDPHGIKRRREALFWDDGRQWTQDDVANFAECNPQDVGQLERGERRISKHLANILVVLDKAEKGLIPNTPALRLSRKERRRYRAPPRFPAFPDAPELVAEMKVYSVEPNSQGGMRIGGAGRVMMKVPWGLEDVPGAYAVRIWGSGMVPKYYSGDTVVVNPESPPRLRGGVIVMTEDREDIHVGEFLSETADEWIIAQFGDSLSEKRPAYTEKHLSRVEYPVIHAIVFVLTG